MAKLPEGRSALTDEQMIGLTHRLVDTCIDCKGRIEELEAKLAKAVELALEECPFRWGTPNYNNWWRDYRTTLAELTGGKDE